MSNSKSWSGSVSKDRNKHRSVSVDINKSWTKGPSKSWDPHCGKPGGGKTPPVTSGPKPSQPPVAGNNPPPSTNTPSPSTPVVATPVTRPQRPDRDSRPMDLSGRPNVLCSLPFPWAQNHCDKKPRGAEAAIAR